MTKLSRSALNGGLLSRFPDNIIKFITALRARLQLTDISDSKFNLEDDNAFDVNFSNPQFTAITTGDALVELLNNFKPLASGSVLLEPNPPGNAGTIVPIAEGSFTSCELIENKVVSGTTIPTASIFRITMPNVGTSNYQVIYTSLVTNGNNAESRIIVYYATMNGSLTNTSFDFMLSKNSTADKPISVEMYVMKKF